jgi:hypothetical protein
MSMLYTVRAVISANEAAILCVFHALEMEAHLACWMNEHQVVPVEGAPWTAALWSTHYATSRNSPEVYSAANTNEYQKRKNNISGQ